MPYLKHFQSVAGTWRLVLLIILPVSAFHIPSTFHGDEPVRPYGLDHRKAWTTSRITGSPLPLSPFRIARRFPKLSFKNPVVLTNAPGSSRLYLVELGGDIYTFRNVDDVAEPDLCFAMKQSLAQVDQVYGLTFHPRFAENRLCYICYRTVAQGEDGTRVSQFEVSRTDPPRIDGTTEKVLITWLAGGHNGGCLAFGPDGYLYISTGDGGPAFPPDPLNSGQDVTNLLSSILRIDVNRSENGRAYAIPPDNPFVDLVGARGEVWSYGFRNPWKMSFDAATEDLWVGDVGWELWEMVYRVERGGNYGWSLVEGPQPVHRERTRGPTPVLAPAAVHSHIESRSITGGFVYRGSRLPELAGAYVYGDYVTGKIWALKPLDRAGQFHPPEELVDTPVAIICFGVDNENELYLVGYDGTIFVLEKNEHRAVNSSFPKRLSDTGLFASVASHQAAEGVLPYRVRAEPWLDGATAERFIALPNHDRLGIQNSNNAQMGLIKDSWSFPPDTVFMKTISLELERGNRSSAVRLETQILHYDVDTWRAYDYVWNAEQTDAVLADDAASERVLTIRDPAWPGGKRQQTWRFASRTECLLCHTTRGGSIYGFNPPQLDCDFDYGRVTDNQLRTLGHLGVFDAVAKQPAGQLVDPYDGGAELDRRARSYLHVNCAQCHRRGGGGTAAMDVQIHLKLDKTNLMDARATQGSFGIHAAQVLAAGDPYRSILYYRMAKVGQGRMPYLGSSVVDDRGLRLIHDWIASLSPANAVVTEKRDVGQVRRLEGLNDASPGAPVREIVDTLLGSPSGALALQKAVADNTIPGALRQTAIDAGVRHDDIAIRDLFERFLAEDRRTKRLGSVVRAREILELPGDQERGRQLFYQTAGVQCRNCHRLAGQGIELGPDLSQIGKKYDRVRLLEEILEPSRTIEPKYLAHLIETIDGRVIQGILIGKDDKSVVLKDAQAKEIHVPAADVELMAPQQKSLMPELLLNDLTAQQVADLIEFLSVQK